MPTDGDASPGGVRPHPRGMTGRSARACIEPGPDLGDQEATQAELLAEALALVGLTYGPTTGLLERAERLARQAAERGFDHIAGLAELTRVDILTRSQRIPEGVRMSQQVLDRAMAADDAVLAARAHVMLAGGLWRLGARAEALSHTEAAAGLLDDSAPLEIRSDLAMMVALVTGSVGAGSVPTTLFERADRLARRLGNAGMVVLNLNNLAWLQYRAGQLVEARANVAELRSVAAESGFPLSVTFLDTIAMVLLECGETPEALSVITEALRADPDATDLDGRADLLLTYAEIELRTGDNAEALRAAVECLRIATARGLAEISPHALRKVAAAQAAMGDYRAAYDALLESYTDWETLRSREAETAASVMQTVYDLDTARRTSQRFQEAAEQDSLTGLWNRRYLNARLPVLLDEGARTGQPLCVALLDLDHFKEINDQYSHDTGDAVLRVVGRLLSDATDAAGATEARAATGATRPSRPNRPTDGVNAVDMTSFAVRLGGEEFLLVLPGMDRPVAMDACERLRSVISAHPWSGCGLNIVVTTSIGVTKAQPGDTSTTLLRRADENLYRAKRTGRDRVTGDPGAPSLARLRQAHAW